MSNANPVPLVNPAISIGIEGAVDGDQVRLVIEELVPPGPFTVVRSYTVDGVNPPTQVGGDTLGSGQVTLAATQESASFDHILVSSGVTSARFSITATKNGNKLRTLDDNDQSVPGYTIKAGVTTLSVNFQ